MSKLERWVRTSTVPRTFPTFTNDAYGFHPRPRRRQQSSLRSVTRKKKKKQKEARNKNRKIEMATPQFWRAISTISTSGTSCSFLFLSLSILASSFYISVSSLLVRPWHFVSFRETIERIFIFTNRRLEASKDQIKKRKKKTRIKIVAHKTKDHREDRHSTKSDSPFEDPIVTPRVHYHSVSLSFSTTSALLSFPNPSSFDTILHGQRTESTKFSSRRFGTLDVTDLTDTLLIGRFFSHFLYGT